VESGSGAILVGTQLSSFGNISLLKIAGALQGADIASGIGTVTGSGYIEAGHIGSAIIGSIQAGTVGTGDTVTDDGAIAAASDISSLSVTGAAGIVGNSTNAVEISAYGRATYHKTDLAFGKISVAHNVTYTNFLAGYDQSLTPSNGVGSIGSVVVGGNWSGSNLVAGAEPVTAGGPYGDSTLITTGVIPTIASIIVKGQVVSAPVTVSEGTYGFISGKIGAFSVDGAKFSVKNKEIDPVGQSDDTILEQLSVTV
jgi:hypothetical protein